MILLIKNINLKENILIYCFTLRFKMKTGSQ
jgi:hypothetical protein